MYVGWFDEHCEEPGMTLGRLCVSVFSVRQLAVAVTAERRAALRADQILESITRYCTTISDSRR
jgi:hypothetical protein